MLKYQGKPLKVILKILSSICLIFLSFFFQPQPISAAAEVLGVHILNINEIKNFRQLFTDEQWRFVTVPLTLNDLDKQKDWQAFFDQAEKEKIIPVIRLSTRFNTELAVWEIPSRKDIVNFSDFLSSLDWHQNEKFVIIFNEVNHAKEWGGKIDPPSYAAILEFSSSWFKSEGKNYKILPAAMDLAANNSYETMEAFTYLNQLYASDTNIFKSIDYWNSHSYPNPGFSSSPTRTAKNSLRGFLYELDFLREKTGNDYQVFITETGWTSSTATNYYLDNYYLYALQHIWSDPRVKAVTPFVMKGSPGPFAAFSFFDDQDKATIQVFALQKALKDLARF